MKTPFETSFFHSSINESKSFLSLNEFDEWFANHCKPEEFKVKEIPFSSLEKWSFVNNGVKLSHDSGRFFSIEGIHVTTNFGNVKEWEQPIINQPEIGILGFITKVFDGTRFFLMQAKMEPGNINILQISPTLQATKSNFTRVHQGKSPDYLDFFVRNGMSKVLIDQLQTEQGGRFLRKRNRNIVIEINDDIPILDNFCWLSMWQMKELMKRDNILNMDTRSVLSTIPLIEDEVIFQLKKLDDISFKNFVETNNISDIGVDYIKSFLSEDSANSINDIISWYTDQKVNYDLEVISKPLNQLKNWTIGENEIKSDSSHFVINAVQVKAGSREVTSWTQPLIKDHRIGLLVFVTKKINGIIHFLVQAKVEPGNRDIVEMSPTISCSNYEGLKGSENVPFLFNEVVSGNFKIIYDAKQSEEGGRFYQMQNRNMILEDSSDLISQIPSNYIWMTLSQMKEFMRFGMFNIEARSLISSISFK